MMIAEDRPPYVVFETRALEDRTETLAKGHYVAVDVDFAIITPSGSKDRVEVQADQWFAKLEQEKRNGRFPDNWLQAYKSIYKEWKEGREAPLSGTALSNWPGISPAQLRMLADLRVHTVEDLAALTEEGIHHLGMGARALKDRAAAFLSTSADTGKVAEENARLKADLEAATETLATLEGRIKQLEAQLPKGPERPQPKKEE